MRARITTLALLLLCWPALLAAQETLPRRHHSIPRNLPARMREVMRLAPRPDRSTIEEQIQRRSRPAPRPEPPPMGGRVAERQDAPGRSPLQGLVLVMLMAAAIGLVLSLAIRHVLARDRSRASAVAVEGSTLDAAETLAAGRRHLEEGRLAEALRAFYLHAVSRLRRLPGLADSPHLSDAVILRRLGDAPLREPFLDLSRLFQPIRYGGRPADENAARRALEDARVIEDLVAQAAEDAS